MLKTKITNTKRLNYFDCLDAIYLYQCSLKKSNKNWTDEAINTMVYNEFKDKIKYCLEYAENNNFIETIEILKNKYGV